MLTAYLTKSGYSPAQISQARSTSCAPRPGNPNRSLYDNNKAVYGLLRYGVSVKIEAGKVAENVRARELGAAGAERFRHRRGSHARREPRAAPRPRAVRQRHRHRRHRVEEQPNLDRRRHPATASPTSDREFNEWFFSTVQIVFAGSDSEGMQYGTIGTEEKYFLRWKEDEADNSRFKLDKYLLKMCARTG